VARESARIAAWALVAAGVLYFAAELGAMDHDLATAALVGAALAVLVHLARTLDPAWLLTAALLSTMFAGHWSELGLSTSLGPHRVLLAAGVLAVLLRAPPARDRPPLRLDGVHLALAAALGFAFVSALAAGTLDEEKARFVLLDQFGLMPFLLFLVAPVAFATERQRMILLGGLVAAGAYLSITAVLEKLDLYDLLVPGYIGDPTVGIHFGRARGPFVEGAANGLALYACTVAAAIAFVVWRRPWPRTAAAAVMLLAPIGVLLTVTRGPWLAGIAGTLVALATTAGLRRYLVPAAAIGTAGVLAAFALIPGLAKDAQDRENDKAPVYERQNTNAAALRMVADRPFFGFGWERGNAKMEPYFRLHPNIPLTGAAAGLHNVYLQYAVGLGLVGFCLWLLAVGLVFVRSLTARAPPDIIPWQVGLKAFVVAWLIVGLFSPAHYAFADALVFTWAGMAYAAVRAPAALRRQASPNGRPVRAPELQPQLR
jgi:O-antigen ligase